MPCDLQEKGCLAKQMKLKHAEIDLARESKKDIPGSRCSLTVKVTGMKTLRYS